MNIKSRILSVVSKGKKRFQTSRYADPRLMFLARETVTQCLGNVAGLRMSGTYRRNGVTFTLEHGSGDVYIFEEIFLDRFYEFPPEVRALIPEADLKVMDLGGNVGLFGLWTAVTVPGSELLAIEADPANAARYRSFVKRNNLSWQVIEAFASAAKGVVQFEALGSAVSRRTEDGAGITVPSIDIFPLLDGVDILKMDIEGGEWDILCDPRFADNPIPVLVLEYHPEFCPGGSAKAEVERLLHGAGYTTIPIMTFGEVGMVWAYRPKVGHRSD